MSIHLNKETILSLRDVTKLLPRRRGGKNVSVSCVYRWTGKGCKGVVLESIQIGGTRCSSKEALKRFFDQLGRKVAPKNAVEGKRHSDEIHVERELKKQGF